MALHDGPPKLRPVTSKSGGVLRRGRAAAEIASEWDEWMPVAQRAATLGWSAPFAPDEWTFITASSALHQVLIPEPRPESAAAAALTPSIEAAGINVDRLTKIWTAAQEALHDAHFAVQRLETRGRHLDRHGRHTPEYVAAHAAHGTAKEAYEVAAADLGRARVAMTRLQLRYGDANR